MKSMLSSIHLNLDRRRKWVRTILSLCETKLKMLRRDIKKQDILFNCSDLLMTCNATSDTFSYSIYHFPFLFN